MRPSASPADRSQLRCRAVTVSAVFGISVLVAAAAVAAASATANAVPKGDPRANGARLASLPDPALVPPRASPRYLPGPSSAVASTPVDLSSSSVWEGGSRARAWVRVDKTTGAYTVDIAGERWLASAPTEITLGHEVRSSADGTLVLVGAAAVDGEDAVGKFQGVVLRWAAPPPPPPHAGPPARADNAGASVRARSGRDNLGASAGTDDGAVRRHDASAAAAVTSANNGSSTTGSAASVVLETAVFVSLDGTTVRFNTTLPLGASGASVAAGRGEPATADAWGRPSTAFPSFAVGDGGGLLGNGLGFVSYSESGLGPTGGVFPDGYKSGDYAWDGVPLALLNRANRTAAVLSPSTRIFDTVCGLGGPARVPTALRCGVAGTVDEVPVGWQTQMILHFVNAGMTPTMLSWGDALLALNGKRRPGPTATPQVALLGQSTVGHYFYGVESGRSMEQTLADVARSVRGAGLPYGYWLVDSFWYREYNVPTPSGASRQGFNGTWRWDDSIARDPSMFPSGLAALSRELGARFVMHMGEWVGSSNPAGGAPPYAANESFDWVVEANASLPRPGSAGGRRFWDWLFEGMASVGLATYKLDHTQQQMPDMQFLLTTAGATSGWLNDMAAAAARHGVSKQYGGHIASGFLHSVTVPNAVVARVSTDYSPFLTRPAGVCAAPSNARVTQKRNVLLGKNSLFPWAVGLVPYKDAFMSGPQRWDNTTCIFWAGGGYTFPEWWGLQEAFPELHAVVAALSFGPVAPGDGVGDGDPTLVMRTCDANGTLLKPDRPALAIDAAWERFVFEGGSGGSSSGGGGGSGGSVSHGDMTHTGTSLSSGQPFGWHCVLGVGLDRPYVVTAADLPPGDVDLGGHAVAWWRRAGQWGPPGSVVPATAVPDLRLPLPAAGPHDDDDAWGNYTLWHTARVGCGGDGWAMLGEFGKAVPVSWQRFTSYTESCGVGGGGGGVSIEVTLAGAPGEAVEIAVVPPHSTDVRVVRVVLSADGTGSLRMPSTERPALRPS